MPKKTARLATATAAAVYCRISDDREDERGGVDRQEEDCRSLAESLGWPVSRVFTDNDISAYDKRKVRPAWRDLLVALESGECDGFIAYDLDRVTRQPIELEHLIDLVERTGIPNAVVTGETDLSTDDGRFVARIKVNMAHKSSSDTARRVRRKHLDRARKGLPLTTQRPYGYLDDQRTLHPVEGPIIQEAVGRILAGESFYAVATDFRERGLPTRRGGVWAPQNLRSTLSRPSVGGVYVHKGEEFPQHKYDGLVPEADWRAIVALTKDESRKPPRGPRRRHLLSGFVRCGTCGERLRIKPRRETRSDGMPRNTLALYCEKRVPAQGSHAGRIVSVVEEPVVEAVLRWLEEFDFTAPTTEADGAAHLLATETSAVEQEIVTTQSLVTAGELSVSLAAPILRGLEARLTALRGRQVSRLRSSALTAFVGTEARAKWDAAGLETRRAVLAGALEVVTIYPTSARGTTVDLSAVVITWSGGQTMVPAVGRDEWLENALAAAPDAAALARAVGRALGVGEVVDDPWKTWPEPARLDPAGAGLA